MEFVYIKHINLALTTSELKKIDKEKYWFLKLQPTTKKGLFTPTNNKKFYKIAYIDILLTYMVYLLNMNNPLQNKSTIWPKKKRMKARCSLSLYIFCGISIISDEFVSYREPFCMILVFFFCVFVDHIICKTFIWT